MRHLRTAILWMGIGAILLCAAAVWLAFRSNSVGTHPIFGRIHQTMASDQNDARPDRLGRILRTCLPARVVSSRSFPYQFRDQPRYLRLNGFPMEWSIGGIATGWLYFHEPNKGPAAFSWEFAPSSATNLLDLTAASLPTRFYTRNDTNLQKVFGFTSNTNALKVEESQVLFARHIDNPNCIYGLHLVKQDGNRLTLHYCAYRPSSK
jgi:hypothetical protein